MSSYVVILTGLYYFIQINHEFFIVRKILHTVKTLREDNYLKHDEPEIYSW